MTETATSDDLARLAGVAAAIATADPTPATVATAATLPTLDERPCFLVFPDQSAQAAAAGGGKHGARRAPGVWFFSYRMNRGDAPPTLTETHVCGPVLVDAVTTDSHGGNFGRLLKLRDTTGKWHTWAMPMELLASNGDDLRRQLLSMGLDINHEARGLLIRYLTSEAPVRRVLCTPHTGWTGSLFDAFVLPSRVIGPGADGVIFQGVQRDGAEYSLAGSLPGWIEAVGSKAVGNPILALALCTAFAGPLLSKCSAEGGGVHLVGDSSTGKSTAVEVGASVWGGAAYRRSWRATANGMEGAAAMTNDSLLVLDEINECDPREVGAIIYSLGNGQGKQRASRSGGARPVARWRCMVLSSGERSVATVMLEAGQRQLAGQAVRMLDVPTARTHGAWDDLHGAASGVTFADELKRCITLHHGYAGERFLERLTHHKTDLITEFDRIKALPEFATPHDISGQMRRAAGRFALLALAGELATVFGCTGWPAGEATKACSTAFAAWCDTRHANGGNLEINQVAQAVQGFIDRHGDSRFSDARQADQSQAVPVRDRAGWWRDGDGPERIYLFTADGMGEALKGFDIKRATGVLLALGAIPTPGSDGKRARPKRIGGRRVRVYEVNPAALFRTTE